MRHRIVRCFVATCWLVGLLVLGAAPAVARTVIDSAGRPVDLPGKVTRVFAAGPPAAVLLYVIAPQAMIGWPHAPRQTDKPLLLPSVRDLPALGSLTSRGHALDLARLIAAKPDLIID